MEKEKAMNWWLEQFSGLENDSCPAIDFPDNEQGGSFACLSVIAGNPADPAAPLQVDAGGGNLDSESRRCRTAAARSAGSPGTVIAFYKRPEDETAGALKQYIKKAGKQ